MKTQRKADIVLGCLFALFGILITYASTSITSNTPHKLPPETFPMVVGILLFVCGSALAVKSWSIRGADSAIKWPDREAWRLILVTLAGVAAYIALLNRLGLPIASFLYIAFSIWYLKRSKWLPALVIGVITAAISYFLFIRLLALSFPAGPFLE